MKTIEAAKGKWHGVLKELGVDVSYLRNVHGPCPLCGGNDRFRFDDKDGAGTYYCNACGAGDGMKLAIEFTGMQFKDLAARIDGLVGNIAADTTPTNKPDPERRISRVWNGCESIADGDPVQAYLRSRNLPRSNALRINKSVSYYEGGQKLGNFPCMVAPVVNSKRQLVTLHLTHLTPEGAKADVSAVKKILPTMRELQGSAIRLTPIYERIGIAEGIETALAVMKIYQIPCWAAINAEMMERFVAPDGVEFVTVFADNDANYRGQAAAYRLAFNLMEKQKKIAVVEVPERLGDYADILKGEKNEVDTSK